MWHSRFLSCATWLAALSLLFACDPEVKEVVAETQVSLRVEASDEVRAQMSELRAGLYVLRGSEYERRSELRIPAQKLVWPLDIPIVASSSSDDDAEFEVVVDAYAATGRLAQTRVVTHFVARKHVWVSAPPLERCANLCASDTCHGASCQVCVALACVAVPAQTPTDALDRGARPPGQDAARADAASDAGEPRPAADGGRDAARDGDAESAQSTDGALKDAAMQADATLNVVDAGGDGPLLSDAQVAGDAGGVTPRSCPMDHGCKAPYSCVPTTLGYTCRGQFADWPMPDAVTGAKVAPSYTSDGEIVIDNVTKLEWQVGLPAVYPGCTQLNDVSVSNMQPGELCTRSEGRAYCDNLAHGGKSDWRLPSLIELSSLFDTQRADGEVGSNTAYFGDVQTWAFVTDSLYAAGPSLIWGVNFYARVSHAYNAYYARVRCVRGGAEPPFATPAERYLIDASADTVTDRATGLVWQRTVSATKYATAEVEARCTGGYRVPTPNELLTLVDPTRAMPAIDPVAFPNTPSDMFWTSPRAVARMGVHFARGALSSYIDPLAHVRCVR